MSPKWPPSTIFIIVILSAVVLNLALWLLAVFAFPQHDTAILHYSIDVGIDFIGQRQQIIVLPIIGLCILIGNLLLGWAIHHTHSMSAWLLWSITPIVQLILIGSFLLIWQANL